MPKIQPFTHAGRGDVSSHVIVTSLPEVYDLALERLEAPLEREGYPGFKLATGEVHGLRVTVAMRPVGPSALAILVEELFRLGASVVVSVDTALAIAPRLEIGSVVLATAAIKGDGVSRNYIPVEVPAIADFDLLRHVQQTLNIHNIEVKTTVAWSLDTYYVSEGLLDHAMRLYGKYASILDMDTAALYTMAMARRMRALSVNVVEASAVRGVERGSYLTQEGEEVRRRVMETFEKLMKPLMEAVALHMEKERGRPRRMGQGELTG